MLFEKSFGPDARAARKFEEASNGSCLPNENSRYAASFDRRLAE
jgi:hypothetical protein